ncbi:plant UBX domain-containing protein 7-like [Rutidosis leptorrhynchoides]|uniref:plant UBX domain-containing protein 7-like n=1 Tax=Rutidosis leptorrhynchoides TaxID=125765 RepID=UPI003A995800
MDGILSANEQQLMVSSFLEIAAGQTADTARQFLEATSWKLEEAIQLFFVGDGIGAITSAPRSNPDGDGNALADHGQRGLTNVIDENAQIAQDAGDGVRAPLPVVRETLYDDALMARLARGGYPLHEPSPVVAFRNFDEEVSRPGAGVWGSDQGGGGPSTTEHSRDNLASLYRPPFHLMFQGPFEKAKDAASVKDKWLLVNLQSTKEFSSHMLNRDTWGNEAVSELVGTNFIFWQVYDDTTEGRKVRTYYRLDSIPVVLVIDPITGQKMRAWTGMIQPECLLEDLVPFLDGGPKDHHITLSHKRGRKETSIPPPAQKIKVSADKTDEEEEMIQALAASMRSLKDSPDKEDAKDSKEKEEEEEMSPTTKNPIVYQPLPEEPKGDRSLLCRVGVRLPDGRRVQRNFLRTDPIQLLWSFCASQLEEAERKPFRLAEAIPGATKSLDYNSNVTFAESGLANSMISVTWE